MSQDTTAHTGEPRPEDESGPDGAPDAPERAWPPRAAALPENPYRSTRVLELDTSEELVAPPPPPDFTETRLARTPAGGPSPDAARPRAVAYDGRRRPARTGWERMFDVQEEDFRRRRRLLGLQGAATGAFCMGLVCLSFLPLAPIPVSVAALVGGGLGVAAAQLGDSVWTWLAAMGLAGLAFAPLMESPVVWFIAEGSSLMTGWLAGLAREARR
ncbi:MAG: hypothetical protein AAFP86_00400 [Planctomycetota bacterium]